MAINKNIQEVMPPKRLQDRHLPCILLCDRSGSMKGIPIQELNQGLIEFHRALQADANAPGKVDVSVISFGSDVTTDVGFRSAEEYEAPVLSASGVTSMNTAINEALDALESRKDIYRKLYITHFRPWLFVLTDGYPTDEELTDSTRARLQDFIRRKKVNYIPMGIGPDANIEFLRSYYPDEFNGKDKPVLKAQADNFKVAFNWFSNSMVKTTKIQTNTDTAETEPLPSGVTLSLGT